MDTLVCYYSRSGHSKAYAKRLAKELNADLREIVEVQRRFLATTVKRRESEAFT